jgi:predicted outer membrane repeat protein
MKRYPVGCLAVSLALGATGATGAVNELVNGSFESGLEGWERGGSVTVESAAPYAPTDGTSLVAFGAMNKPVGGWIRQTATVSPGRSYQLFFDIGNLAYVAVYQKMRIEVTEPGPGGTTTYLINHLESIPGNTTGATTWSPLDGLGFTPTGSSVTVTFRDASGTSGGLDLVIDNVKLERALTFIDVTTLVDENDGALGISEGNSLREVLDYVATHPNVDEIRFGLALAGGTIELQHGELQVRTPIVIDATQWAGTITIDGGGQSRVMHLWGNGETTLRGLVLRNGSSTGPGGGLLIDSGPEQTSIPSVKLLDCTIEGNRSLESGGGIAVSGGVFEFVRTRIQGNRAAIAGGGIWFPLLVYSTFESCTFSDNRACGNGGAVSAALSKLSFKRCTLSNNRAGGAGGAVWSHAEGPPYKSGWLDMVNCTLHGNVSTEPGAAIHSAGACSLTHCTLAANGSPDGGGVHAASGHWLLANSVLTPFPHGGAAFSGVNPDLFGNNRFEGDPMLAPLADYGGGTETMPPLPGSPCIEAAVAYEGMPATDQRGETRPLGPLPDIGAVEAFPLGQLQPLSDNDGDGIDDRIEPAYGLAVGEDDSARDSDGDGSRDAEEILNMTDPRDPVSLLRIGGLEKAEGFDPDSNPVFDLWFDSFPGLHYTAECDESPDFTPAHRRELDLGFAEDHITRARLLLAPRRDFVRIRRDP